MKVSQLREIFESAAQIYRDSGNAPVANSLGEISTLFVGSEPMTVSAFANLIAKVTAQKI